MTPADAFEVATAIARELAERFPTVHIEIARPIELDLRRRDPLAFCLILTEAIDDPDTAPGTIAHRVTDYTVGRLQHYDTDLLARALVADLEDFLT